MIRKEGDEYCVVMDDGAGVKKCFPTEDEAKAHEASMAAKAARADALALIAAVWVNPAARDADAVYRNNRAATRAALAAGRDRKPGMDEVLAARVHPFNPFFDPR